jgi:hypothetical protein
MIPTLLQAARRCASASILTLATFVPLAGNATASGSPGGGMDTTEASSTATIRWDRPATNANGAPAGAMSGYRIYFGQASNRYTHSVYIADGSATSGTVTLPSSGRWYFVVAAVNAYGYESAIGFEVSRNY